jgi:hypothetical protein
VKKHDALYRKAPLRRIDVQLIEKRLGFVVDYVFKSVKKRRVSWDDLILLPKSSSELKGPMSEMKQKMAKWIDVGLLPKVNEGRLGPRFEGTPEEETKLVRLAKQFRATFELNCNKG